MLYLLLFIGTDLDYICRLHSCLSNAARQRSTEHGFPECQRPLIDNLLDRHRACLFAVACIRQGSCWRDRSTLSTAVAEHKECKKTASADMLSSAHLSLLTRSCATSSQPPLHLLRTAAQVFSLLLCGSNQILGFPIPRTRCLQLNGTSVRDAQEAPGFRLNPCQVYALSQ